MSERKPNPKYASFSDHVRSKKLRTDLEKHVKSIEMMLNKISGFDVVINCDDIQLEFDNMAVEWQNFQRVYDEYATLSTNSKELHTIGI